MKEHANFITGIVAAIAAAIVVPAIWQGNLIAWVVTAVLFLAVVVAIALYWTRRSQAAAIPTEDKRATVAPPPVNVELISTHDQSIAAKNKIRSTVNVYNSPPPAQSEPAKDAKTSDG